MICSKCGKEIEGNRMFCPSCGARQAVSGDHTIEHELLESMKQLREDAGIHAGREEQLTLEQSLKIPQQLAKREKEEEEDIRADVRRLVNREVFDGIVRRESEERNAQEEAANEGSQIEVSERDSQREAANRSSSEKSVRKVYRREAVKIEDEYEEDEDWEEFHLDKKDTAKQKRMKLIGAIAALSVAILAVVFGIIFLLVHSTSQRSYEKQLQAGEKYWKSGDYEAAITAFENAVDKAKDNTAKTEALSKLANVNVEYGDENTAIYYFEEEASLNKMSNEDVATLVGLYENKADVNAIRKLADNYSNSETEAVFEKHLLNQPIFNYKSGTYNELLTVEITAADNEQIFYTLDNSEATPQSTPYTEPIVLSEGTTVVRAVALNSKGLLSDEIITTYEVKLDIPPEPIISPDTGSYTDITKIAFYNIPTNCKAYYTIDGSMPTADSIEYTGPFDMMLGNYVITAVCINQYTGQRGPIAMRIYDLSVSGKITYAEAAGRVLSRLQEMGEVESDSSVTLLPVTVRKIGGTNYYIVKRYQNTVSGLKEQGSAYAVDVNTGGVFRATDNGADEYNLSGL